MPQGDGTEPQGQGRMKGKSCGRCNPKDGSTPAQGERGNASGRGQGRGSCQGAGSMTGGRRGLCNPAIAAGARAYIGPYSCVGGLGLRRGFRGGFGRGDGLGRGYGRGYIK